MCTNTRIRIALLFIAIAGLGVAILLLPLFSAIFWLTTSIAILSLAIALTSFCLSMYSSRLKTVRALTIAPVTALIILMFVIGQAGFELWQISGSIHTFKSVENHTNDDSRPIHIAYLKLTRNTANTSDNPIVYLAGGPGGSGTMTMYKYGRYDAFLAMRDAGDVIVYDQRGTMPWAGDWSPCKTTWQPAMEFEPNKFIAQKTQAIQRCAKEFKAEGKDPSQFTTNNNAHDLEVLRQSLGVNKLRFWATSYGTHLALAYIKLYPNNVESAVFHGTEGLNDTLKTPYQVQNSLEALALYNAEQTSTVDKVNKVDKSIGLLNTIYTVLKKADKGELKVIYGDEDQYSFAISKWEIQFYISQMLRNKSSSEKLIKYVNNALKGNTDGFSAWAWTMRTSKREALMPAYTDCASYATKKQLKLIASQKEHTLLGDAINFPFPQICKDINALDLGDQFRSNFNSDVPILFISGSFDARTPVENARNTAEYFSNAQELILPNAGHGNELFFSSPGIINSVVEFFSNTEGQTSRRH
ncbi:MAG: pimeloyl-ACP methyl ester carboxylesterase [Flavobacteriales bacterium]|jgi:pimeloyl-ACP methyl ester carboxylesterase